MMTFDVQDALSGAGRTWNEDVFGVATDAVWVLDGATGLGSERMLPGPSDAHWLVSQFDAALQTCVGIGGTTDAVLDRAMAQLRSAFARDVLNGNADFADGPSASFVMARLAGESLELINLGDCKILHRRPGSEMEIFGTSRLEGLDRDVREAVVRLAPQNLTPSEVWQRVLPLVRSNRALRNRPDGYWTLDVSGVGIAHLQRQAFSPSVGDDLLLLSDGFYRLVDIYGRYTALALFDAVRTRGIMALYAELRAIEQQDDDLRLYPRLKGQDDATAIWISVKRA